MCTTAAPPRQFGSIVMTLVYGHGMDDLNIMQGYTHTHSGKLLIVFMAKIE